MVRVNFFYSEEEDEVSERKKFNKMLGALKVPSEHDRRPNPVANKKSGLANFKSKDFKLQGLFLFLPVAREIFGYAEKEKARFFLLTTFIYRALMVEDDDYNRINRWLRKNNLDRAKTVHELLQQWLPMWTTLYGPLDCHYNHHIFMHADQSRQKTGPLYRSSTER